jgi:hypothetical protein
MARFRPHEPSSRLALAAFLRGHRTKQLEEPRVDPEAAVRRLDTGLCYRCGELIEQALFRLGSPRCHDCRDSANHDLRPD